VNLIGQEPGCSCSWRLLHVAVPVSFFLCCFLRNYCTAARPSPSLWHVAISCIFPSVLPVLPSLWHISICSSCTPLSVAYFHLFSLVCTALSLTYSYLIYLFNPFLLHIAIYSLFYSLLFCIFPSNLSFLIALLNISICSSLYVLPFHLLLSI
jgi:hypothetical protein